MSRSRVLTVGHVAGLAALAASSSLATAPRVGFNPRDRNVIENKGQALPKGAQKAIRGSRHDAQAKTRAAAADLVRISNQTLVVAHLHPRWLRRLVEEAMDRGANIALADVEAMRSAGSETAARSLYWGYLGTDDIQYVDGHGPLTSAQREVLQAEFSRG